MLGQEMVWYSKDLQVKSSPQAQVSREERWDLQIENSVMRQNVQTGETLTPQERTVTEQSKATTYRLKQS